MTEGPARRTIGATQTRRYLMADTSSSSRYPLRSRPHQGSPAYEKIVPILLVSLGVVMLVLILFALGVLLGLIRF